MKVRGDEVGKKVCAVLGLDPTNVAAITIEIAWNEAVVMLERRYLDHDDLGRLVDVFREERYTLTRMPEPETAGAPGDG